MATLTAAQRAKQSHDDYRAIVRGINTLAAGLADRCLCQVPSNTGAESASAGAPFDARLNDAYGRASEAYVARLRSQGATNARSLREYLDGLTASVRREQQDVLASRAWHLVKGELLEALALLAVLHSREIPAPRPRVSLFRRVGPVQVVDKGRTCYVWTQQITTGHSGMRARPDILLTDSPMLDPSAILSIQECKHKKISASDLRSEFGKAYDLKVAAYTLVAYRQVPARTRTSAAKLGIEIIEIGLDGPQREEFVSGTKDVGQELSLRLRDAEERSSFALELRRTAQQGERKMLTLRR